VVGKNAENYLKMAWRKLYSLVVRRATPESKTGARIVVKYRRGRNSALCLRGSLSLSLTLAAVLSMPATALDMTDMVVDSISAHPEVKEKIHLYRQVANDREIATGGWLPSVDLEASTGVYELDSPALAEGSEDFNSTRYELSVTQNLFNGYDTTYQIQQADARIRSALYDVYDTADNIALRAIQAYLDVLLQRRLYRLALENVNAHKEILAQIRDRNQSGVGRRSQLQQTEGRLARAQAGMIAQQNNLEDSATLLHQVLGRYVDPETLIDPELPVLPQASIEELTDQALTGHPAMLVAQSNIVAAQAAHLRSLRSRYPNLDLQLATEHGEDVAGIDGETDETRLTLNLTYNLYRGGRDEAEQRKKVSEVYEQKEFAAGVRRQVINTLRLSWTADDLLVTQIKFLDAHVQKAGETVVSYREEFFIGQRDLVDVLDARNELNTARNQQAEALYEFLGARYRVYEGIGQLFAAADVGFELKDGNLRVARLQTNKVDKLPLPVDEDKDLKLDPMDHCDNTLPDKSVNPYGCVDSITESARSMPLQLENDYFNIEASGMLVITVADLLANDDESISRSLKIIDVDQPENGQVAFNLNGDLVYRPAEGFTGSDYFQYLAGDGVDAVAIGAATVHLKVSEPEPLDLGKVQLVNFNYDEASLTDTSESRVKSIIDQLKQSSNLQIEIYTYTDNIGSNAYNLELSSKRAAALKTMLVRNGIKPERIKAFGMGEKRPLADNSTPGGQAINRRGEFVFKNKP
jgi:outer membrane protein, adhesin transport system